MTTNIPTMTEEEVAAHINKELSGMKKEDLIQLVKDQSEVLVWLESKITSQKKVVTGRKEQVLKILQAGPVTVAAIAARVGITNRNVSSQLSYLKKDGHIWLKDQIGRLHLQSDAAIAEFSEAAPKTILRKAD